MKAHRIPLAVASILLAAAWSVSAGEAPASVPALHVPEIDELIRFPTVNGVAISPDGRQVAFGVSRADFEKDAYVTQLFLAESTAVPAADERANSPATASGAGSGSSTAAAGSPASIAARAPIQLTRGEKSSTAPSWSPDGQWIAFLSPRAGDKNQIFAIPADGGEALQLTKSETAVSGFDWSPDGKQMAFTAAEPESKQQKARQEQYGDYDVVRGEYAFVQLFTLEVAQALKAPVEGQARTKDHDRSLSDFSWSPYGTRIAFSATRNPDLVQGQTSDVYLLDLKDDSVTPLVTQPGPDGSPRFSPDGRQVVFESAMGQLLYFARNTRLAVVDVAGGAPRSITDAFDEDASLLDWKADGVYFQANQKTASHLFRVDPTTLAVTRVTAPADRVATGLSLSADARRVAFASGSPTSVPEVWVSDSAPFVPKALTTFASEAHSFLLGTRETVRWKSQDGTEIEGVLIKPRDFDPKRKHALLTVIHGGPTGVDRPILLQPDARYYPSDLFVAKGGLVLKVNYRGSAGYGERFRRLNERNLGVGDAWDVLSGIDHLIAQGFVDPSRLGSMGWSQGGYISAFSSRITCSADRRPTSRLLSSPPRARSDREPWQGARGASSAAAACQRRLRND